MPFAITAVPESYEVLRELNKARAERRRWSEVRLIDRVAPVVLTQRIAELTVRLEHAIATEAQRDVVDLEARISDLSQRPAASLAWILAHGGPSDAAATIGLQPDGYVILGGLTFFCAERATHTAADASKWLSAFSGPAGITNAATAVNVSTGSTSATIFRLRGITPSEIAIGNANSPPVVW